MAEPTPSSGDDTPESIATFVTDASAEAEETGPPETDGGQGWSKPRWTVVAIAFAVVMSAATILVARSILASGGVQVGIGETVGVGLVALIVALAAFLPLRWGLWIVPLVASAHYALNFYNMLFTDQSVYQFVEGSAMGYAVLTPLIGVAVGWLAEGVYRLVAPG